MQPAMLEVEWADHIDTIGDLQALHGRMSRKLASVTRELASRNLQLRLKEEEYQCVREDYTKSCQTVAEMFQIVTGNTGGGPKRGVLEDVQDTIDDYKRQIETLKKRPANLPEIEVPDSSQFVHREGL
jgi:hypothetical protein